MQAFRQISTVLLVAIYAKGDSEFLERRYSEDEAAGNLYKCTYTDRGAADLTTYSNDKIGVEFKSAELKRLIQNLDKDKDTSISFDEFMKLFTN